MRKMEHMLLPPLYGTNKFTYFATSVISLIRLVARSNTTDLFDSDDSSKSTEVILQIFVFDAVLQTADEYPLDRLLPILPFISSRRCCSSKMSYPLNIFSLQLTSKRLALPKIIR
jgi:hypothetical protein